MTAGVLKMRVLFRTFPASRPFQPDQLSEPTNVLPQHQIVSLGAPHRLAKAKRHNVESDTEIVIGLPACSIGNARAWCSAAARVERIL